MALSTYVKKFFAEFLMFGHDSNALPIQLFLEDTGEQKNVLYGKASGTITAAGVEATTGELRVVLNGKDSGGNIDELRTNASQQLQVEIVNDGATTRKVLGTSDPAATTNTNLYTVPASTEAEIHALIACNRSSSAVTIRVGIDVGGAGTNAPSDAEWIYYDRSIAANDTIVLNGPWPLHLAADDDLVVYASASDMSFIASGKEFA